MRHLLAPVLAALLVSGCNLIHDDDPPSVSMGGPAPAMPRQMAPAEPLDLGPIKQASRPLPPISGGTLAVGQVGKTEVAVASDPEHDKIWLVDKGQKKPRAGLSLEQGAEPGRVVIDGERALVVLRGAGELAEVNLSSGELVRRVPLCAAPRGVDVDHEADLAAVACMGGELLLLQASTLEPVATYQLDRDLRDVTIRGEEILVSRFRSAELMVVYKDGTVRGRAAPLATGSVSAQPSFGLGGGEAPVSSRPTAPNVAWRMVPTRSGGALMLHQRASDETVDISQPGGYSGGGFSCNSGIVSNAVSVVDKGRVRSTDSIRLGLAVDVAESKSGQVAVAVVSPADGGADEASDEGPSPVSAEGCNGEGGERPILFDGPSTGKQAPSTDTLLTARGVAVAFSPSDRLVVQTRAPHGLRWEGVAVPFGGDDEVADTGHTIFHMASQAGLACASCHPEGGDDGRVWNFNTTGPRRTQPLQGGLKGTAPFHWSGDMSDFSVLMDDVFTGRMSGPQASPEQASAVLDWLDQVPAPRAPRASVDEAAVRGKAVYEDAQVGCLDCHSGPRFDGKQTVDVGTGEPLQVPTLRGVGYRAPFLHNGCAATLRDRFDPACGGGDKHGKTSQLSAQQLDDLVAYLESL